FAKGNYAEFLVGIGDPDGAIRYAREALAIANYGAAHRTLAKALVEKGDAALWDMGDPEAARASFDAAIEADPTYSPAYYRRAAYYQAVARKHADPSLSVKVRAELEACASVDAKNELCRKALARR
ncbi:MAG TPA: tetratricopeptide repeat protein, partial [Minicystis sp.]|nr:tetratricopeptide repeat protein [Minicystis sp.]